MFFFYCAVCIVYKLGSSPKSLSVKQKNPMACIWQKKGELTGELDSWKEYIQKCFRMVHVLFIIKKICHEKNWNKMKKLWKMEASVIFMLNVNLHQQKSGQGTGSFPQERPILSFLHCSHAESTLIVPLNIVGLGD